MDQSAIVLEIERCEKEAERAKREGDFEIAFLKLDNARRLREKLERLEKTGQPIAKAVGGQST